ncbi:MAG TPA: hypothetical protein VMV23_10780 [Candidatus Nanopelagicaceae bacterium]|nr:hypothetical protein [Candidatus Nanopelagicaceae bacterium]
MAWPIFAILILAVLAGCWATCAAAQVAWAQRSRPLTVVAAAVLASLLAEVAALNGSALGGAVGGLGVVSLLLGGVALAAFAFYLLTPPPPDVEPQLINGPTGPAANPDSEA